MQEGTLSSLLPAGTVTWEKYTGSTCLTVDVLLATSGMSEACGYCGVYPHDHGSDHKTNQAHFAIETTQGQEQRRKRMCDKQTGRRYVRR